MITRSSATAAATGIDEPRKPGLGVFILYSERQEKFFIKAQVKHCSSVLMAEAAALALAANITSRLQISQMSFLTDNQALVNLFNGDNLDSPPDWRIKPFTQRFINDVTNKAVQVLKIETRLNITAHSLATRAFRHDDDTSSGPFNVTCTNTNHPNSCRLSVALQSVTFNLCTPIATVCC